MDKNTIIVSAIAGVLGAMSVILAFVAEGTKSTLYDVVVTDSGCINLRAPEIGLGAVAALLLVGAQVTVAAASGCCGCCCGLQNVTSRPKRTGAIVLSVLSWAMFLAGFGVLILGATHGHSSSSNDAPACYVTKTGVFSMGAVFSLLAASLGITSYILFRKSGGKQAPPAAARGVMMAQPQFPPPASGAAGQQQFPINVAQPQFPQSGPAASAPAPAAGYNA